MYLVLAGRAKRTWYVRPNLYKEEVTDRDERNPGSRLGLEWRQGRQPESDLLPTERRQACRRLCEHPVDDLSP